MPFIPNPLVIAGVKLAGYAVAGAVLDRKLGGRVNPWVFSIIRVGSGLLLGIVTLPVVAALDTGYGNLEMLLWLLTTRLIIWSALIWALFEFPNYSRKRFAIAVMLCVAWSFALDGVLYLIEWQFPDVMNIPWC